MKQKKERTRIKEDKSEANSNSSLYFVNRPPVWWKAGMQPCSSFAEAIETIAGDECVALCEQFFNSNPLHVLRSSDGDPLATLDRERTDWHELVQIAENNGATSEVFSLRRDCPELEPRVLERLTELAIQGYLPSFVSQYGYVNEKVVPTRFDLAYIETFGTKYLSTHRSAQHHFYAHIRRLLHSGPEVLLHEDRDFDEFFRGKGDHGQQYSFPYEVKRFIDAQIEFHQAMESTETPPYAIGEPPPTNEQTSTSIEVPETPFEPPPSAIDQPPILGESNPVEIAKASLLFERVWHRRKGWREQLQQVNDKLFELKYLDGRVWIGKRHELGFFIRDAKGCHLIEGGHQYKKIADDGLPIEIMEEGKLLVRNLAEVEIKSAHDNARDDNTIYKRKRTPESAILRDFLQSLPT
jgi:hypothetical protein